LNLNCGSGLKKATVFRTIFGIRLIDNFSYLGDTTDKIGNVRAHCPDGSQLFFLAEPFFNTDRFFVGHGNIDSQMLESL
jgi:hypothetical protein